MTSLCKKIASSVAWKDRSDHNDDNRNDLMTVQIISYIVALSYSITKVDVCIVGLYYSLCGLSVAEMFIFAYY